MEKFKFVDRQWEYGSVRRKSREETILVQEIARWRLATHSNVLALYDGTNAFCCSRYSDIIDRFSSILKIRQVSDF